MHILCPHPRVDSVNAPRRSCVRDQLGDFPDCCSIGITCNSLEMGAYKQNPTDEIQGSLPND